MFLLNSLGKYQTMDFLYFDQLTGAVRTLKQVKIFVCVFEQYGTSQKKYHDHLLGACSTQKVVKIQNKCTYQSDTCFIHLQAQFTLITHIQSHKSGTTFYSWYPSYASSTIQSTVYLNPLSTECEKLTNKHTKPPRLDVLKMFARRKKYVLR